MLVDSDLGYMHPLISAAELLSIIAELEEKNSIKGEKENNSSLLETKM
jgi:hypothetical protein